MELLAAAVVVVGVLCVLDLVLTLGVVRRLREHTAMLARSHPARDPVIGLATGQEPRPFTATSTEGKDVKGPAGLSVVAFFSTSCPICPVRVPTFIAYVRAHAVRRDDVLAVVVGSGTVPYLPDLTGIAHVCSEPLGNATGQAFAVAGFPAFFVLDSDGIVRASGYDPETLPAPIAV